MRELGERTNGVCPHCGYDNRTAAQTSPHALLLGTVLQNRYVIGRVLGQGGFGITYIGYDLKLETRVCIKEYFPDGAAWRSSEQSKLVSWGGSTNAVGLKQGRESFVKEARKAVRLRDISGVVQVWDVFYENETAYIVMSYVEGVNLKDYLMKELKRPLTPQECMNLMTPVIQGLSEVHRNGIVHRDISPDNLMLRENRTLVLLDLGAAKDMTSGGGQSSQIVAKAGFSPPEQYVSGGNIGPWTDVYAMSATIYYCLTGKLPPTSVERFTGRNIDFSFLPATLSNALQKGMELKVEDRWQNMNELYAALDTAAPDAVPAREIAHKQQTAAKTEATVLNHSSPGQANASVEDSGVSMKASETEPLLRRAFLFLEDGDWEKADEYCEKVLDHDPENAQAYLGKLMAELRVCRQASLADCDMPFDSSNNYQKAVRFGDSNLVSVLNGYINHINERNENARLTDIYNHAVITMNTASTEDAYKAASDILQTIAGFRDADALAGKCLERAEVCHKDTIYRSARSQMTGEKADSYEAAMKTFRSISGWKDSDEQIVACRRKIEEIEAREESERLEQERQTEQKRIADERTAKKRKRTIRILTLTAVGCIGVFLGYFIMAVTKKPTVSKPVASQTEITSQSATSNSPMPAQTSPPVTSPPMATNQPAAGNSPMPVQTTPTNSVTNWTNAGDYVIFGSYEQDNNMANGKEPIEWLVLAKDENRILVISRYALDCQQYNTSQTDVTWETCSLRKWLNETFLNVAFSKEEQERIPSVNVSADKNPICSTDSGNNTTDQLFLLSILEAKKYFSSDDARNCAPTDYAVAQGVEAFDFDRYKVDGRAACCWWLRSPGSNQQRTAYVLLGPVDEEGFSVSDDGVAVRPALWLNLESDTFKNPEEESEQDNAPLSAEEISTVKETGLNLEIGANVTFGSYEQDNNMANGKEPIEWLVLAKDENRILIISKYALDCQQYNTSRTDVTWETCSLRKWLNETFINTAFSKEEQERIPNVTVSTDKNTSSGTNPGNSTTDQVFLLSIPEANKYFSSAEARKCAPTDYAVDQGVGISDSEKVDGRAACWYWWLRAQDGGTFVESDGSIISDSILLDDYHSAVRPALWINLDSSR